MIITEQMFKDIGQFNGAYAEMVKISPLPQEYDVEMAKMVEAKNQNLVDYLEYCKPFLIKASDDYTLGKYRVYDPMETKYLSAPTFDGIEDQIAMMQEEFYQANKNGYIASDWIAYIPTGGEIWNDEDFENLMPNQEHRVYDFETGDNILFKTTAEAKVFIDGQIEKVKQLMPIPVIQQQITYNGSDLSGWLTV